MTDHATPPVSAQQRLAVYGTLAPGRPNAHVLSPLRGTWTPGVVRGTLYADGWGAALGYPGIVLDPDGPAVPVQLFTSEQLPAHWARLDDFEGEGYVRVRVPVRLDDDSAGGEVVAAMIYALSAAGSEPR